MKVWLGFNVVKGNCVTNLEPVSEKVIAKNEKNINKLAGKFYRQLLKNDLPKPSLFDLFIFRVSRTSMKIKQDNSFKGYRYSEKGWFSSDFFYRVKLSPVKKAMPVQGLELKQ